MVQVHDVKYGRTTRKSYSRIADVTEMPNLIAIQKDSYRDFVENGLNEVFKEIFPIKDHTGKRTIEYVSHRLEDETNYSIAECKERDATFSSKLRVTVRLTEFDSTLGEKIEKETEEIFFGDFPRMTDSGTFIINGAERVIVSQLVRSPGAYYVTTFDKSRQKDITNTTLVANRGAWLEYEIDFTDSINVRIDRNRKMPATVLFRALSYDPSKSDEENETNNGLNDEIFARFCVARSEIDKKYISLLGDDAFTTFGGKIVNGDVEGYLVSNHLENTIKKEQEALKNAKSACEEIYKKLRPGEPPIASTSYNHLTGMFFDSKRYDFSKVGRYKFNKKLSLARRIDGLELAQDVKNPATKKVIAKAGTVVDTQTAYKIQDAGVNVVVVRNPKKDKAQFIKVIGNNTVDINKYVSFDASEYGIKERVYLPVLKALLETAEGDENNLKELIVKNESELCPRHLTIDDVYASFSYLLNLDEGVGFTDDIDHLGNRRIRCVGELLQNQFRIGLTRIERNIKEKLSSSEINKASQVVNTRPVSASIREFFGSSQLSQFMDQTNPLAELANKRRLSALGPGGLNRDRATFEVRDVHYTHYGRMCPIETPEGPNIGLIGSLCTYARINEYGFIETPYRRYDKTTKCVTHEIDYLMADEEDKYIVAQANSPLDEAGHFTKEKVVCRHRDQFIEVAPDQVDYMDVSPQQVVSVAAAMIPFLENDDASRALMGSNMQRQAVPLIRTQAPVVATGIEYKAAHDSGTVVLAKRAGRVKDVTGEYIIITAKDGTDDRYDLIKFLRSNQTTCINQRPIVKFDEWVEAGDVIADGPSTDNGEIALGRNTLIGFMTWEGYNYEDAVLISEKLVKEDAYTSIHIEEYECEARDTKLGAEEITNEIPHVGADMLKNLDSSGVVIVGTEVKAGDILVGKVTPKGETELTAEEKLLRAIFGEKARDVRDTSLKVPHGSYGVVVAVKEFNKDTDKDLPAGVNRLVRIYVAQKRKISVGDKMAGRHGNKGVVSRVLPEEDMPFLPDGTPLEIVLNPLGVPSRMNIGQVLEVHLGYAAKALDWKIATPVFDGASESDIIETLKLAGKEADGKTTLYDGRTGEPFDSKVTVGYMYYLKLHHLVDDKIHARSIGPYSMVTQQPLGGKAQFGGQRFGEMEVWALEAYGAAYTLQEILTIKSDDTVGRVKTYESIVKGENVPEPGVPESFKVLVKELQSLSLDVKIFDESKVEIPLKETEEDYIKNPDKYRVKKDIFNPDFAQYLDSDGNIVSSFNEGIDEEAPSIEGEDAEAFGFVESAEIDGNDDSAQDNE